MESGIYDHNLIQAIILTWATSTSGKTSGCWFWPLNSEPVAQTLLGSSACRVSALSWPERLMSEIARSLHVFEANQAFHYRKKMFSRKQRTCQVPSSQRMLLRPGQKGGLTTLHHKSGPRHFLQLQIERDSTGETPWFFPNWHADRLQSL